MKLKIASIQEAYRETFPEYFHGLQLCCAVTSWGRSSIFVFNCSWQISSPQSCSLSWIAIFPLQLNSMLWKEPPFFLTLPCAPFIWCLLVLVCNKECTSALWHVISQVLSHPLSAFSFPAWRALTFAAIPHAGLFPLHLTSFAAFPPTLWDGRGRAAQHSWHSHTVLAIHFLLFRKKENL